MHKQKSVFARLYSFKFSRISVVSQLLLLIFAVTVGRPRVADAEHPRVPLDLRSKRYWESEVRCHVQTVCHHG